MYITRAIINFAKKHSLRMGRSILVSFIMSAISLLWMIAVGGMVTMMVKSDGNQYAILGAIGAMLFMSGVKFVAKRVELNMIHGNSVEFKRKIRVDLMGKLFAMGPMLYDEERTGKLANMIWMKVDWLEYYFNEYLPKTISMILFQGIVSIICIVKLGSGGAIYAIAMLMVIVTPNIFHTAAIKRGKEEWEAEADYTSDSLDGIQGIATLKSLNYVEKHQKMMRDSAQRLFDATMKNVRMTTFENNFMSLFIQIAKISMILWMGKALISSGVIGNEFFLFLFMIIGATDDAYKLLGAWIKGAKGICGIDEIIEFTEAAEKFIQEEPEMDTASPDKELEDVVFENIHFAYQTEDVLKGTSLVLQKGKTTALVGPSGCGKSTVAYLLSGFYQPDKGEIILKSNENGKRLFKNRKQNVAAVWQDSRVFHTTIYENILMGNKNRTEEDVIAAAKKAKIHDKIMALPDGYQTVIGDGGEGLSGGEKQRIIIARAILKDTPILILDEATAHLDGQNEQQIQSCIKQLSKEKAILSIAHRLDTVKTADVVCFMKAGRVMAQGTHKELSEQYADYRKHFGIGM